MILDVLLHPCYKEKIQSPPTKYFIRKIWSELREKIKMFEALEGR